MELEGKTYSMEADDEGFFEHQIDDAPERTEDCTIHVDPTQLTSRQKTEVTLQSAIDQFSSEATVGIISDIDDTILETGVVSRFKWRLIFNTLFVNPTRRRSFPLTASVFRRLVFPDNPIFYISNSPWNMHSYLEEYLDYQAFPKGILLLRDINFMLWKSKNLELQSKYREILKVLRAHKELSFVLIGDAGEVDVDIYERIAKTQQNRISAIYIRSVRSKKRMARVRAFAAGTSHVPILVFDHSKEMAAHASSLGLIGPSKESRNS